MRLSLILGVLSLFSIYTQAQKVDTTITIKAFTIQGIRTIDSLFNSPINTVVISKKEVENAPIQSTSELLNFASGIDVKNRGGLGVQSDISIRGGTYDQSLVLVDGIKMSDPQTGHHMMNLPVFVDQLERVEMISNGGSRWFGPYAFSGAINLITKKATENALTVRLSGGEYGYVDAGIAGSIVTKKTSTTISMNHRKSDGYISNTDFDMTNLSLISTIDFKPVELKLNLGMTDKNFGAQSFYTANYPNQFEATRSFFGSAQAKIDLGKLTITPRGYYRRHYDRFELYREQKDWYQWEGSHLVMGDDTAGSWYNYPNYHRNEVRAGELNLAYVSKFGTTHFGAEYRHESVNSNNLGDVTGDTLTDYDGAFYTKYAERENTSVFFEHNGKIQNFRFSIGMLANFHSVYGDDYMPGLDVSYDFTNSFRVFAGANKNIRFPTFTDLYYSLGGAQGSINLKPEESQNYQLGLRYKKNNVQATATGFYRKGDNLIDWVRYNGATTTQAANITQVNFIGVEFDGYVRFNAEEKGAFLKGLALRYTGMEADQTSDGFESNYVLDYLNHKFYAGFDHKIAGNLMGRWSARVENRTGGYFDKELGKEVEFTPYALVDFRLYQEFKGLNWYVEIANIFNTTYRDIGIVPQPGRWLRVGAKYTLNFKKKA
ncbi:MAG: TonB-dependent receptor [Salibacteraceae bacterium]